MQESTITKEKYKLKKDIIKIVLGTSMVSSLTLAGIKGINNFYIHRLGAKQAYNKMIEEGNIPKKLDITYIDDADSWTVIYQDEEGKRVERSDVDIHDFLHDLYISSLDNGVNTKELATSLSYAGVMDSLLEKTMDITSEEIEECELENYFSQINKERERGQKKAWKQN